MRKLDLGALQSFACTHITTFHDHKLKSLHGLDLKSVLRRKNPYLYRAKNLNRAADLVSSILDAYLSSSEEKSFGDFLEELAVFIIGETCDGRKSSANGIDLEFENKGTYYLVSVKSGPNWGNSAQQREQENNFKKAS
jgi:hypothetical protein